MASAQKRGKPGLLWTWGSAVFPLGKCLPTISVQAFTGGKWESAGIEQKKKKRITRAKYSDRLQRGPMGCF